MHGNVVEWCSDWYGENYYAVSPENDPQGPEQGSSRIYRGGSINSPPDYCRSAFRGYFNPDFGGLLFGIRVVRQKD